MFASLCDRPQSPSSKKLNQIWAQRYLPDLSCPVNIESELYYQQLATALTPEYRLATAAKLTRKFFKIKCERASLQAQSLYSTLPNLVSLSEAQRLANTALQVYLKLADVYQIAIHRSGSLSQPLAIMQKLQQGEPIPDNLSMTFWGMPSIEELAEAMDPILKDFYQEHSTSQDWRTTGFLTTLLNFSNRLILNELSQEQQWILLPYLRFVEEQVAIPWQQVCLEAGQYSLDSPMVAIVEQGLAQASAIAHHVYQQLCTSLPQHQSRRGTLDQPAIKHSVVRDLQMIQSYFWLSFLQQQPTLIQQRLVPLFIMVNSAIDVHWRFVLLANHGLMDRILAGLDLEYIPLVYAHANQYVQAFTTRQSEFKGGDLGRVQDQMPKVAPPLLEQQGPSSRTLEPNNLRELQMKLADQSSELPTIQAPIDQYLLG